MHEGVRDDLSESRGTMAGSVKPAAHEISMMGKSLASSKWRAMRKPIR